MLTTIISAIILGAVQGATEFFPVSSSGHLLFFHQFLSLDGVDAFQFDVLVHLGTIVALVVFFWHDLELYAKAFFRSFVHWDVKKDFNQKMAWLLFVASIPAIFVGAFFSKYIVFARSTLTLATMLIIGGVLFLAFEALVKQQREIKSVNLKDSVAIGIAQVLAFVPGVSRSGVTILAGMGMNMKRAAAARFSFLLAIPVVGGAGLQQLYVLMHSITPMDSKIVLFVGFLSAAITGFLTIKYFLLYLQKRTLNIFGWYRILFGLVILLLLKLSIF